jgi:hypothetical protein
MDPKQQISDWTPINRLPASFPFTRSWAYKNHHLKRFPHLFSKLSGRLFINLRVFNQLLDGGRLGQGD